MILYPFGLTMTAMLIVALLSMAMFGAQSAEWADWQIDVASSAGTVAGLAGAVAGLWLAIHSDRHAVM
jgi:hypothetical protein